jgi:predicted naringenin-chalcone synthase
MNNKLEKKNKIVISNFEVVRPKNEVNQDEISHWLAKLQAQVTPETFDERVIQKFAVKSQNIEQRSFFSEDFGQSNMSKMTLFRPDNNFNPTMKERSIFFRDTVEGVFKDLFIDKGDRPDEIIHVSCTGYVSPSAGQKIIPMNHWENTGITHAYHMGCYAAMPAIKIASGLKHKNRVDIVHTELCSLHLDVLAQSPEQTVVQTLFADGAIKYTVNPNGNAEGTGIEVLNLKEKIIPGSEEAMTWGFGENNLQMTLHRKVPVMIKQNLLKFVEEVYSEIGFNLEELKKDTIFAIHPGGPKIIDQIVSLLGLTEEQVKYSRQVLRERGNMSSATLPHVWDKIVNDDQIKSGTKIFSVAFGPGLTIAGFLGVKT